jgi:hypothetical protein
VVAFGRAAARGPSFIRLCRGARDRQGPTAPAPGRTGPGADPRRSGWRAGRRRCPGGGATATDLPAWRLGGDRPAEVRGMGLHRPEGRAVRHSGAFVGRGHRGTRAGVERSRASLGGTDAPCAAGAPAHRPSPARRSRETHRSVRGYPPGTRPGPTAPPKPQRTVHDGPRARERTQQRHQQYQAERHAGPGDFHAASLSSTPLFPTGIAPGPAQERAPGQHGAGRSATAGDHGWPGRSARAPFRPPRWVASAGTVYVRRRAVRGPVVTGRPPPHPRARASGGFRSPTVVAHGTVSLTSATEGDGRVRSDG